MLQCYRIIMSREAAEDLAGIHDWIAKDSERNASAMVERLLAEIQALQEFPHRYAVTITKKKLAWELRTMPVPPYRVLYWIEEEHQAVRVLAVQHGRRDSWA